MCNIESHNGQLGQRLTKIQGVLMLGNFSMSDITVELEIYHISITHL